MLLDETVQNEQVLPDETNKENSVLLDKTVQNEQMLPDVTNNKNSVLIDKTHQSDTADLSLLKTTNSCSDAYPDTTTTGLTLPDETDTTDTI